MNTPSLTNTQAHGGGQQKTLAARAGERCREGTVQLCHLSRSDTELSSQQCLACSLAITCLPET